MAWTAWQDAAQWSSLANTTARPTKAVASLAGTVSDLSTRVESLEGWERSATVRLTAVEQGRATAAANPATGLPASAAEPRAQASAPKSEVRDISGDITTGSIMKAAPKAAASDAPLSLTPPAAKTSATGQDKSAVFGARLTSGPTIDALRLNWSLMNEKHRDLVGGLQTRYRAASTQPGAAFQLIVGPFMTADDAGRFCRELAIHKVPCGLTGFHGEQL